MIRQSSMELTEAERHVAETLYDVLDKIVPRSAKLAAATEQVADGLDKETKDYYGDVRQCANAGAKNVREKGLASTMLGLQVIGTLPIQKEKYVAMYAGVARQLLRDPEFKASVKGRRK